jgi:type IV fimbrial biogenesis protein FimT
MKRIRALSAVDRRSPTNGFTLIELMVTIVVAAVLMMLAAPAMQSFMSGRAVAAQSGELAAALRFARAEAMKRSAPVTVCRTTPAQPSTCAGTAGTWQSWMVFADRSTIGSFDNGDVPLRVENAGAGKVDYPTAADITYVSFQSTGIVVSDASLPYTWQFNPTISTSSPSYRRYEHQVCLNAQGRVANIDGNASCTS